MLLRTIFPRFIYLKQSFRSRSMSVATTPTKLQQTFLVFAPDYTDEGALERRLKVRQQHMSGAMSLHTSGFLKIGGAFLSETSESPQATPKIIGSMLLVRAGSLDEAKQKLEADIYWTAGVWDKERLSVWPFLQAPFTE